MMFKIYTRLFFASSMMLNLPLPVICQKIVNIQVDVRKTHGDLKPVWAWFGYDEPNYTYMKDGLKLLSEISALSPIPVYVRCHNLLTSGDGKPDLKWGSTNVYTEDAGGRPVYDWHILDSIFDSYFTRGMKPLAQIGFMPEALSVHPKPYRHFWKPGLSYNTIETGWAYPPKDYKKWSDLIFNWVQHCVSRYGKTEVESWYWEVWNEPDGAYWKGTWEEFFKLYDYAADGLKRALPAARIGGADVTGGGIHFTDAFLKHCFTGVNYVTGKIGSPLDVILFHAKGSPDLYDGKVRMNISRQLNNVSRHFELIASFSQAKNIPVIIGESDPEGCAACSMQSNPENAYRNGTLYSSYTAASLYRIYMLAQKFNIHLLGAVNWSFEFENQAWFAGFRDLSTNGVDKPVLNVFRMLGKMKGERAECISDGDYSLKQILDSGIRGSLPDIGSIATVNKNNAYVLVWNYHDLDGFDSNENPVEITLKGISSDSISITRYAADQTHSNSYSLWKKFGSPENPSKEQIIKLAAGGQLQKVENAGILRKLNQETKISFNLAGQAVSLIELSWPN